MTYPTNPPKTRTGALILIGIGVAIYGTPVVMWLL